MMISLTIVLNGDGVLKGIPPDRIVAVEAPVTIAALEGGMASGLPSIGIIMELPDGRKALAQTSMRLFLAAADAMRARFGDLLTVNRG